MHLTDFCGWECRFWVRHVDADVVLHQLNARTCSWNAGPVPVRWRLRRFGNIFEIFGHVIPHHQFADAHAHANWLPVLRWGFIHDFLLWFQHELVTIKTPFVTERQSIDFLHPQRYRKTNLDNYYERQRVLSTIHGHISTTICFWCFMCFPCAGCVHAKNSDACCRCGGNSGITAAREE